MLFEPGVYGFSLPVQGHLKTAFAMMDGFLEKVYGRPVPADLRRKFGDFLLKHRLNPDDISRTESPEIEDLLHYDTRGLNAFNVLNMVEPRGKRTWVCFSPQSVYTPEFKKQLISRLDPVVSELRKTGLIKKAYLYTFDERGGGVLPDHRRVLRHGEKSLPRDSHADDGVYPARSEADEGTERRLELPVDAEVRHGESRRVPRGGGCKCGRIFAWGPGIRTPTGCRRIH